MDDESRLNNFGTATHCAVNPVAQTAAIPTGKARGAHFRLAADPPAAVASDGENIHCAHSGVRPCGKLEVRTQTLPLAVPRSLVYVDACLLNKSDISVLGRPAANALQSSRLRVGLPLTSGAFSTQAVPGGLRLDGAGGGPPHQSYHQRRLGAFSRTANTALSVLIKRSVHSPSCHPSMQSLTHAPPAPSVGCPVPRRLAPRAETPALPPSSNSSTE